MASAPKYFIRSLIRAAQGGGASVLESILQGQFTVLQVQGGRQLTAISENGKSFSFLIPSALQTDDFMASVEEALTYFLGSTPEQITRLLSTRPIKEYRPSFLTAGRPYDL